MADRKEEGKTPQKDWEKFEESVVGKDVDDDIRALLRLAFISGVVNGVSRYNPKDYREKAKEAIEDYMKDDSPKDVYEFHKRRVTMFR